MRRGLLPGFLLMVPRLFLGFSCVLTRGLLASLQLPLGRPRPRRESGRVPARGGGFPPGAAAIAMANPQSRSMVAPANAQTLRQGEAVAEPRRLRVFCLCVCIVVAAVVLYVFVCELLLLLWCVVTCVVAVVSHVLEGDVRQCHWNFKTARRRKGRGSANGGRGLETRGRRIWGREQGQLSGRVNKERE